MQLSVIVKTCKGREAYVEYLKSKLPNILISMDTFTDSGLNDTAYQNFIQGLEMAVGTNSLQLEDDIILCDDFYNKALAEIEKHSDSVIQFFSMRKDDLLIGSRWDAGSKFMMTQCVYIPQGLLDDLIAFAKNYLSDSNINSKIKYNSPYDCCVAAFLKSKKLKYWIVVPNLVDHIIGVSAIDKRRSKYRQSLTFLP